MIAELATNSQRTKYYRRSVREIARLALNSPIWQHSLPVLLILAVPTSTFGTKVQNIRFKHVAGYRFN